MTTIKYMNLNKVILVGRVTRDPEIRTTTNGQNVAQIGLATNRVWNKDGQKQESTEFHNIVAGQYMKKGALILVEGRLQTRSWQAQDGTNRYRTEVVAESIQLGPRSANQGGGGFSPQEPNNNFGGGNGAPTAQDNTPTINLDDQGEPVGAEQSAGADFPEEIPSESMPF
jgi:single-strand DNA-binding protein